MLTDVDVRTLVEFESHDSPVLSVYLNFDPTRKSTDNYKLSLRNLLSKAVNAAPDDLKRVQNFVEMGYNWQGRGLVMFSCAQHSFWWAQSFAVPVSDSVFVSFRPYVRQLASLLDTYERYGVIHVDQEGARLYLFNMGNLEAVEGYLGEEVKIHKAGGWSSARYQRHEVGQARQNLQEAAELAEEFYRRTDTRHLLLAGTDKNVARFKDLLSHRLRRMVVGAISAKSNATPAELGEKALQIAKQASLQNNIATADEIVSLASSGGNAVVGLAETLTAVQSMRASHVAVIDSFVRSAYRFVDSGHILLELNEEAQLASGRIQELPDAVDSVLRRAMAQGIGVTLLDQHTGLEQSGKIGALTRY